VSTAVRFLQDGKIHGSDLSLKKVFLRKKGLKESEIEEALSRAKSSVATVMDTRSQIVPEMNHSHLRQTDQSLGTRVKDILNIIVLIAGLSYGFKHFWKKYIVTWWFGPEKRKQSSEEKILLSSREILKAVETLQNIISNLQKTIETPQPQIKLAQENHGTLHQMKLDIEAIKGILLSSRAFPVPPILSTPSLPSWQLDMEFESKTKEMEEEKEDDVEQEIDKDDEDVEEESGENGGTLVEEFQQSNSSSSEIEMISGESGEEGGTKEQGSNDV